MTYNYLVKLTSGESIPIDADEVEKVLTAIQKMSIVRVKRGIFNAKYFVSMVEDYNRVKGLNHGVQARDRRAFSNLKSLPDIFAGMESKLIVAKG